MRTTDDGRCSGGEGGIRTPDTVARMPHFECGAFNHSATSPGEQAGCGACVEHEPRKRQYGRAETLHRHSPLPAARGRGGRTAILSFSVTPPLPASWARE